MAGILRFVGLMNAAVWLGATVFFIFGAEPVSGSREMKELLTPKNFPYYSVAIGQLVAARYYQLHLACSLLAVLHAVAEWLYFGKYLRKPWLGLLAALVAAGLLTGCALQPRLREWHAVSYAANARPDQRAAAAHLFVTWQYVFRGLNIALAGGLACFLWRLANPQESARLLRPAKFG